MIRASHILFLLRGALALAFLYPAIASFIDPITWGSFVPQWVETFIPLDIFLVGFSVFEIAIAVGLFIPRLTFWASTLAACILVAIVVANPGQFVNLFRDISLALVALALALLSSPLYTRTR